MMKAFRHGLANLANFSGRDARQAFWYYVLIVYIIVTVITAIVVVPVTLQAIFAGVRQGMEVAQSGDPERARIAAEAGVYNAMATTMSTVMWGSSLVNGAMMLLLASSFVRRLHDSALPGWWALIPGAIYFANLFVAPVMMREMMLQLPQLQTGDPQANMQTLQGTASVASLLGWIAILIVVFLGIRKSTPGPNRYGDAPFVA